MSCLSWGRRKIPRKLLVGNSVNYKCHLRPKYNNQCVILLNTNTWYVLRACAHESVIYITMIGTWMRGSARHHHHWHNPHCPEYIRCQWQNRQYRQNSCDVLLFGRAVVVRWKCGVWSLLFSRNVQNNIHQVILLRFRTLSIVCGRPHHLSVCQLLRKYDSF